MLVVHAYKTSTILEESTHHFSSNKHTETYMCYFLIFLTSISSYHSNMGETAADWDPLYGQVEGMYVWRDMLAMPCMPKDMMDEIVDNFVFRPDDVLMASYPQSSK